MDVLEFEGKEYVRAKSAARELGYTSDYIGQLCRSGKIDARLVGRNWYVDLTELSSHKKSRYGTKGTRDVKKKRVSESTPVEKVEGTHKVTKDQTTSSNYKEHIVWNSLKYEPDDNALIPPVKKEFVSKGGIKITVTPTDSETLEVQDTPGSTYSMSATELPEVHLKGVLKIQSAENEYEELIETESNSAMVGSNPASRKISLKNEHGVVGMKRGKVSTTSSKPESGKTKKTATPSFLDRLNSLESKEKIQPEQRPKTKTETVIAVSDLNASTQAEEVEIKVSITPYVMSAVVLAVFTLVMLLGLNSVISTTEVATSEYLDFNVANLRQVLLGL